MRKKIEELDNTIYQQYLISIDRTLHPITGNKYFFQALVTIEHVLGHDTNTFIRI